MNGNKRSPSTATKTQFRQINKMKIKKKSWDTQWAFFMFRTLHTHPNRNYKYTPTLHCSGPSRGQGLPGLGNSLRAISRYRHPDKFPTPRHRWGLAWKPPGPQKSLAAKTRNESGAGAVPSPKRKFLLVKILSPCLVDGPGEVWGWRLEVSPREKALFFRKTSQCVWQSWYLQHLILKSGSITSSVAWGTHMPPLWSSFM